MLLDNNYKYIAVGLIVGVLIQRRGISRSKTQGGAKKLEQPLDSTTYISKGKANLLKKL